MLLCSCQLGQENLAYDPAEEATAAEDWELAARLWNELHLAERTKTERTYLEAARAFHENGETEGACALIRRGLLDFPDDPDLYALHSVILETCGFHRAAERTLTRLIEISPDDVEGLVSLGRVRMQLGLERAAADPLRRAVDLSPQSVEPRVHLARVHQTCGDLEGSFAWYASAIELGEEDPLFLLDAAALAAEERVVESSPMARELALLWIERIVAVDPQVTLAHFLRGDHLQALERNDEAILSYLRAVETDPGCLQALMRLAELFAVRGDEARTAEFVGRALEVAEHPDQRQALSALLDGPPPDEF